MKYPGAVAYPVTPPSFDDPTSLALQGTGGSPIAKGAQLTKTIYTLRLNADGTLTVRVGRQVETITIADREKGDIFDAVKYALISKDAFFSNERLTRDLYEIIWQYS